jgi:molecular chaperone GrpE (heat shock protein)
LDEWRQANLDLRERERAFSEFSKPAQLELTALENRRKALSTLVSSYTEEMKKLEKRLETETDENNKQMIQQAILNVANVINDLRANLGYVEALVEQVRQRVVQGAPAQKQAQTGQTGGGQVINFGKPPGKVLSGG